jgi:hypothetical protein
VAAAIFHGAGEALATKSCFDASFYLVCPGGEGQVAFYPQVTGGRCLRPFYITL